MLVGALTSGVTTHVPNYLMSIGWTTQGTGYILSVYSIVVLVATIIAGFMMDRWGIQKTVLTMSVLIVLGMICLLWNCLLLNHGKLKWLNLSVKVRDKNVKNGSKKLTTIYFN